VSAVSHALLPVAVRRSVCGVVLVAPGCEDLRWGPLLVVEWGGKMGKKANSVHAWCRRVLGLGGFGQGWGFGSLDMYPDSLGLLTNRQPPMCLLGILCVLRFGAVHTRY
jgi:hypothetical protein